MKKRQTWRIRFPALGRRLRDERGVAAIEFAVFAAIFVPLFIIALDVGFFLRERVVIDHILRMGSYAVITADADVTLDELETRARNAMTYAVTDQQSARTTLDTVTVALSCFCRNTPTATVACTATCTGTDNPLVAAYQMNVTLTYNSIFAPHAVTDALGGLRGSVRVETYPRPIP